MKHGSLFSGIGGFDLAAEWMGWENVFHCEKDNKCQNKLKNLFKNADSLGDIKLTDFKKYANRINVLSGGFPCQPWSVSGERKGTEDERHLWPEMLRAIREIKAPWIVGENVHGIINWKEGLVFDQIQSDLENEGYEVQPYILPASSIGAIHRRDRVWFVAYSIENASAKKSFDKKEPGSAIQSEQETFFRQQKHYSEGWNNLHADIFQSRNLKGYRDIINLKSQPLLFGENDGISRKLDTETEEQLGNAIVPQVVLQIFKSIEQYELTIFTP